MTVTTEQRSVLASSVSRLREIFEEDYTSLAEGKYGIYVSGRRAGDVVDSSGLSLSAHDLAARAELVGVVDYLKSEGLGAVEAVERMLREAVFTTVNRLLAIRVGEALGVLPPSLASGTTSEGFVEALEVFPLLREGDDSGGYWTYLQICGDELSHAVPRLFDRRHPLSALPPSAEALNSAVNILLDPDLSEVWVEPEALGWSYQFFITQEDRTRARYDKDGKPKAPENSHELAVRNQFFTPGYVVDFLVENTLGRRLRESGFELELPLLLGEIDEGAPPLDLGDVSVLDPAVGSGHFLLGAYDLLERAWEERGVSAVEAAPTIIGSLFGIEIDPRAAQVAQAVLYLRARRSAPDARLEPPAVVTARALPKDSTVREEVLQDASPSVRDVVVGLDEILGQAPMLGSLLKPEDYLMEAIGDRLTHPQLGDDLLDNFVAIEHAVRGAIYRIAHGATSTPGERLFAADTEDALRFVELMSRRYDVVLMNPPFGAAVDGTELWLKSVYPNTWTELYGAFLERGLELLGEAGSLLGAITSSQFMTTRTMRKLRKYLVQDRNALVLIDLGPGILVDATVNTCVSVLPGTFRQGATFYRDLARRSDELVSIAGPTRELEMRSFEHIRGTPLAFHLPDLVIKCFADGAQFEPDIGIVRTGNHTFDDFRFLRLHYELTPSTGRDAWVYFPKGGAYQPYLAPAHLLIDWRADGAELKAQAKQRVGTTAQVVQSSRHWYKSGITFMHVSSVGFNARLLPREEIFSTESIAVFLEDPNQTIGTLGLLNSTAVEELLQAFGRSRKYENGAIKGLPIRQADVTKFESFDPPVNDLIQCFLLIEAARETSPLFVSALSGDGGNVDALAKFWQRRSVDAAHLQGQVDEAGASALGFGPEYVWGVPTKAEAIKYAIPEASRPFKSAAESVLAYLVGIAIGRWDIRVGQDPEHARSFRNPLEPLPVVPPGMLTGKDGLPVSDLPVGYPLALPPDRILHDDRGHRWDVVHGVEAAAGLLFDDPDRELSEALRYLKAKDLRSYLRAKFFSQHLKRYSKSRRKAPLYWYMAVPSKEWGLWVYAPWLSREQLFAIARAAQDKLRRLAKQTSHLRRDLETGGDREVREQLETAEGLTREVEVFYGKADEVAQSGWEPDLNDGIILNAAPLRELFVDVKWRKDVAKHREKMENGEYPWATVQQTYFDRLKS